MRTENNIAAVATRDSVERDMFDPEYHFKKVAHLYLQVRLYRNAVMIAIRSDSHIQYLNFKLSVYDFLKCHYRMIGSSGNFRKTGYNIFKSEQSVRKSAKPNLLFI